MRYLYYLLGNWWVLFTLLIINIGGTIYGYIWYESQLVETPLKYIIFVPDSPTASLFFVFVLIAFLLKKNWPIFEALAMLTLFKYGIWAVIMNFLVLVETGELSWIGYMLIASHFAMAVQGLLYSPLYRIKIWHLVLATIWTLHNDVIDYVLGMWPRYPVLGEYVPQIGYFTFWLSLLSIFLTYYFGIKKNRLLLNGK